MPLLLRDLSGCATYAPAPLPMPQDLPVDVFHNFVSRHKEINSV